MRNVERAILSVSDKSGILDLARALTARGVEILSTGGTARHLADAGIAVTPIATWSGAPEILGGDRKSTRLNSSHVSISYVVFCLKKKIYLSSLFLMGIAKVIITIFLLILTFF